MLLHSLFMLQRRKDQMHMMIKRKKKSKKVETDCHRKKDSLDLKEAKIKDNSKDNSI
jgi:hypothetical protein